jgi:CheY-like chemotaxis protein
MVTRILCIDENFTNRRLLSLLLQRLGYEPTVVANEREALAELKSQPPFGLITMDLGVPKDADGIECLNRIRAVLAAQNRRTPIIAITACAMVGDREKCLRLGMSDYLSKPFTSHALATLIARWLETDETDRRRAG